MILIYKVSNQKTTHILSPQLFGHLAFNFASWGSRLSVSLNHAMGSREPCNIDPQNNNQPQIAHARKENNKRCICLILKGELLFQYQTHNSVYQCK